MPQQIRIGVIGNGFVGHATARVWMEHAEVRVYDTDPKRSTHSLAETIACDFVFVCLPTPEAADGSCDTSIVDGFLGSLRGPCGAIVLRSTLPIGHTSRLAHDLRMPLIHSPEFLTARCAVVDAHIPARMIVGSTPKPTIASANLAELYRKRFPGVPVIECSSTESEAIKLTQNAFFAVKVWFFNEARMIAEAGGCDWDTVLAGMMTDGRIAHSHTKVPGPDGNRGFGGACLPKDLANFASAARVTSGGGPLPLDAIVERNQQLRGMECVKSA